ncbi:hypothetical protein O3M35_007465 [Rhynocoris fuscipes]|uniref:UPF3 domain-containing protein n=1 Tax=Rhynocoris fuscipes TaxID=488301 RepID=A0AAW1DAC6_9HEMI
MDVEIEDNDLIETNAEVGGEVKDTISTPTDSIPRTEDTVKDEKISKDEIVNSDITESKGLQNISHKCENIQETSRSTDQVFENGKRKVKEEKPPTKVVVRRLPPLMTKDIFLEQVSPLPPYDYMYFVCGDPSYGLHSFSRAYINFMNQEDVFTFTRTFDNYVFLDAKGQEYPAIVEFSPFQRVPKQRSKKKDTLTGTIESDPMYITFRENLLAEALENSKPGAKTMKQHYFETEISTTEEVNTTPLLEFLKQKRAEKARIRDERREEKKRKEAERKLKQKKEKKAEGEEEETAKDVKIQHCTVSAEKSFNKGEYTLLLKSEKEKSHEKIIPTTTDNGNQTNNNLATKEKFLNCDKIIIKKRKDRSTEVSNMIKEITDTNVNANINDNSAERQFNTQDDYSKVCNDEKNEAVSLSRSNTFPNVCVLKKAEQQTQYLRKILGLTCEDNLSSTEMDSIKSVLQSKERRDSKDKDLKITKKKEDKEKLLKENRTREFKNRSGKSYQEERIRQAERREERKKESNSVTFERKSESQGSDAKDTETLEDTSVQEGKGRLFFEKKKIYENKKKGDTDDWKIEGEVEKRIKTDRNRSERRQRERERKRREEFANRKGFEKKHSDSVDKRKTKTYKSLSSECNEDRKEVTDKANNVTNQTNETVDEEQTEPKGSKEANKIIKNEISDENHDKIVCQRRKSLESGDVTDHKIETTDSSTLSKRRNSLESVNTNAEDKFKLKKSEKGSEHSKVQNAELSFDMEQSKASNEEIKSKQPNSSEIKNEECKPESKTDENNKNDEGKTKSTESANTADVSNSTRGKDPRTDRRIRNKDRPSLQIYRPGMGKFSKQRLEKEKVLGSSTEVESPSHSPSPTPKMKFST